MTKNFHFNTEHMIQWFMTASKISSKVYFRDIGFADRTRSTLNVAHALDIVSDIDIILKAIKLAIKFYTRKLKMGYFFKNSTVKMYLHKFFSLY